MGFMEAIRVSMGGSNKSHQIKDLIARLEKELSGVRSLDWQIYRHAIVPGNILIELRWSTRSRVPCESNLAPSRPPHAGVGPDRGFGTG